MAGKSISEFIPNEDQIISKTYMTRVEGENTLVKTLRVPDYIEKLCVIQNPWKC